MGNSNQALIADTVRVAFDSTIRVDSLSIQTSPAQPWVGIILAIAVGGLITLLYLARK